MKTQRERAEFHHKSNIPSQQRGSFLTISIGDRSKVVEKTDTENIDAKINYAFQTLLFTFLCPKITNMDSVSKCNYLIVVGKVQRL